MPAAGASGHTALVDFGRFAIGGATLLLLVVAFALAVESPLYGLAVPAAVLAVGAGLALTRVPLGHLCGVILFFGVTARSKAGVQIEEVVFAAYYLGYLATWLGSRLWVYREPIFRSPVDLCVGGFLVYMTGSIGLTVLFGGDLSYARADWINFSMLGFYFPIREVCERYRWGPWLVVGFVLYLGLFSLVRNVAMFSSALSGAEHAWQVARGRVPMNEMLLLVPALGCLGFAAHEPLGRRWALYTAGFALFTVGVILTQWRAYYVDLAVGAALFFVLLGWRQRGRLTLATALSGAIGLGFGYLVFGDLMTLLVTGILDRILSIGTSTTADISLLNRLLETESVWDRIRQNPIVGYGIGTTFSFFDSIYEATWTKSYAHNGYLTLWFKFGIIGLGLILWTWGASITSSYRTWRRGATDAERTLGVVLAVVLISLIPSHFVSATFSTSDTVMMFAILTGTTAGLAHRTQAR